MIGLVAEALCNDSQLLRTDLIEIVTKKDKILKMFKQYEA